MKSTLVRSAVAIALFAGVLMAGPAVASEGWGEDMPKAMAQAEKEGKDLLIDFTGSDWCGWCIKLDKEVFTQEPFKTEGPKKFVLVKLDFPRKKKLPEKVVKQNNEWKNKLGVSGFPTIYLTDAKGRPYAKTGYQRGGAEAYVKHLAELQKKRIERDKMLAQAAKAEGVEKAKLLDKAVSALDEKLVLAAYGELVDEIIALDKDDKAGLKSKYAAKRAAAKTAAAQQKLFRKSQTLFGKGDKVAAKAALVAAKAIAPDSRMGKQIDDILERYFKDVK